MKMIVITIINSMSVKPSADFRVLRDCDAARCSLHPMFIPEAIGLPVRIFCSVLSRCCGLGINIENILTAPAGGVGVVLYRAQTPLGRTGHWIDWNLP